MTDRELYYLARVTAGLAGFGIWLVVAYVEYRALRRDLRFRSRKRTAIYVSFPAIYSIGYAAVVGYAFQQGTEIPDRFPLFVSSFVQAVAIVYGVIVLRLGFR